MWGFYPQSLIWNCVLTIYFIHFIINPLPRCGVVHTKTENGVSDTQKKKKIMSLPMEFYPKFLNRATVHLWGILLPKRQFICGWSKLMEIPLSIRHIKSNLYWHVCMILFQNSELEWVPYMWILFHKKWHFATYFLY